MDQVAQYIATLGFPIVVSGALFWYIVTEQRESRKTIDNNTAALNRLIDHLEKEDGK